MRVAGAAKVAACAAALTLGAALRLWASTQGWNYDVESFWIVGHLVEAGKNVYVETNRMPYGPVSPALFALALRLEQGLGFDGIMPFHVIVAGILTLADVGIAVTLARVYGFAPAVAFALSPVSILVTGFHSQIDNLAILLGLWSWRLAEAPARRGLGDIVPAALLLGLSLATKHVLVFFPLCLLVASSRPLAQRVLYGVIAYAVFVAALLPFATSPAGWAGVYDHVIAYRGGDWYANALIARVIPSPTWATRLFIAVMVVGVPAVGRLAPRSAFFAYLTLLVAASPTIANQYLAIPLVACAVRWRNPLGWAYVGVATLALLGSADNVGALPAMGETAARLRQLGVVLVAGPRSTLWPQLCLLLFVASWTVGWIRPGRRRGRW